ncbi:F-box only protein 16 [Trichoplax sp. H2]|nr:F-box only protein 16 [Trichoplax sp. H2]|eukprot:RDD42124.1 F-box only protein 16 [Trichoplax sp. H2]
MAFARNISRKEKENSEKYLSKSAWTPMANGSSNLKVFEERKTLISHWFDKWTDNQRRQVLNILITRCKPHQLEYVQSIVKDRIPITNCDFTVLLPRKINPRSLCRVASTCWRWKDISELDIIWKQKCLRFRWDLPEDNNNINLIRNRWKEHYINKVQQMNYVAAAKSSTPQPVNTLPQSEQSPGIKKKKSVKLNKNIKANQMEPLQRSNKKLMDDDNKDNKLPPWKGPDRKPTDAHRKIAIGQKAQRKSVPLMLRSVTALKSSLKEGKNENELVSKPKVKPTKEKLDNFKLARNLPNQSTVSRASTPGDSFFSKQAWEIADSDSD